MRVSSSRRDDYGEVSRKRVEFTEIRSYKFEIMPQNLPTGSKNICICTSWNSEKERKGIRPGLRLARELINLRRLHALHSQEETNVAKHDAHVLLRRRIQPLRLKDVDLTIQYQYQETLHTLAGPISPQRTKQLMPEKHANCGGPYRYE